MCKQSSARFAGLPENLSETGLYADMESETLAPGVMAYSPQFALWSDGAEKRRWLYLPPDARIDTSNPNDWLFPEGTRLWKEFSHAGTRVETRVFVKDGPGEDDWQALSYVWNDAGTDARAEPYGWLNARGTSHDAPAAAECGACHGGRRSWVLSFSAVQLSGEPSPGQVSLNELAVRGVLSHPLSAPVELPGNATERAALGYLHANCGHCHNQQSPANKPCFDPQNQLDFWLPAEHMATPSNTPTYKSAVDFAISPGDPGDSTIINFVSNRGMFAQMPPIGTDQVDPAGVALLRRWIAEME